MPRARHSLSAILIILLTWGCADVGAPPGGPEDKQGPAMLESIPPSGSLNQTGVRFVEIRLSESVNTPRDARVLISPRPASTPKVHWSGHTIKVEFVDSLLANRTYIISLPSDLTDLRGNRPDSAITVAFSTGSVLDSCGISGTVFSDEVPATGITIGLYNAATLGEGKGYDSIYPDYLAVTGKNGEFNLRNLPATPFRLIAYKKSARDDRFYPTRDKFGIPDCPIDLTTSTMISDLSIALTSQDTLPYKIVSATINTDHVAQLRLSKPVKRSQIAASDSVILQVGQSRLTSVPIVVTDSELVTNVWAFFGNLPAGIGQLSWALEPNRPVLIFDSLRIPVAADSTPPIIVSVKPDSRPQLGPDSTIRVRFSEPIKFAALTDCSVALWSVGDSVTVLSDRTMAGALELVLKPRPLVEGASYLLKVGEAEVVDLSGNPMGDSVSQYSISSYNPDSLGWLEGTIKAPPADSGAPINLTFKRLKDNRSFPFPNTDRAFKLALPAGKFLVTGFVDRNRNGEFDKGKVFPYTLSEPFLPYRDTVSVRARFETAGEVLEFR